MMGKMQAVLMVGISGSGKSTKARKEYAGFEVVERDAIRRKILSEQGKIDDTMNLWSVWKFGKESETEVSRRYDILLAACAAGKRNVVCADTNLSEKTRKSLTMKLKSMGYEVTEVACEIDLVKAWERDERRRDTVGRQVIYDQYQKFLEYKGREQYFAPIEKGYHVTNTNNPVDFPKSMPKCILVDIDGTLAHMNGKRGAFEWDKVGVDDVDSTVRMMVNMYAATGKHVIVFSGRDGVCEAETRKWLIDNGIDFDSLFMRAPGDMRKDSIVKEEMFWQHIAPTYNCEFVIDDRPQVCRMWRELGIKVFQVGDPHVEF